MRVVVDFQDGSLDFELPAERLVAAWSGPPGIEPSSLQSVVSSAIENPFEFPPARQMVVPGDRVVIAFDPTIAPAAPVLEAVISGVETAGVERSDVTVLTTAANANLESALPGGCARRFTITAIAAVWPISPRPGRAANLFEPVLDRRRRGHSRGQARVRPDHGLPRPVERAFPGAERPRHAGVAPRRWSDSADEPLTPQALARFDESFEVSWLLGSQFQLGVVPGSSGIAEVIAARTTQSASGESPA